MSLRSPSRWTRLGHYIGPFALLSVLTSVAFNRALLARERVEQRRLHLLQRSLLEQIFHDPHTLGGSSSSSSSSSPSSLEEQRKLARRLRTLQLDPLQLGFSRQVLPSKEEEEKLQRVKQSTTTWGSALFGSGTVARLQHSVKKARQSIRDRGFGFGDSLQSRTMEEEEEDAAWVRGKRDRELGLHLYSRLFSNTFFLPLLNKNWKRDSRA